MIVIVAGGHQFPITSPSVDSVLPPYDNLPEATSFVAAFTVIDTIHKFSC